MSGRKFNTTDEFSWRNLLNDLKEHLEIMDIMTKKNYPHCMRAMQCHLADKMMDSVNTKFFT